jgi:ABC-type sugar transport system ATPase subunit
MLQAGRRLPYDGGTAMPDQTADNAMAPASGSTPLLRMERIRKEFSGVRVLTDVSFDLHAGEVHVLAGENGAGKSTLMKILSGAYSDYGGAIYLAERKARFHSPHDAQRQGIAMIHQEMSLVATMSVVDNLFLGRESTRGPLWLNKRRQRAHAADLLRHLKIPAELDRPVGGFSVATRQMIEIAKALAVDARVLIMDEPTSALNEIETERLFGLIEDLKRRGCGIVFISHRMEEIFRVGDRITVLRDGRYVNTSPRRAIQPAELVRWMVGRDLAGQFPARKFQPGAERLAVEQFSVSDPLGARRVLVDTISFSVRAGEILGFAGLQDAGNSALFRGLFGAYGGGVSGAVRIDRRPYVVRSPRHAIARGIALLTNDRQGEGLIAPLSVGANLTLAALRRHSPGGWLRPRLEQAAAAGQQRDLGIRFASPRQAVSQLSGGNQQKVVFGKWIETRPRLLLLEEPTRGIDIGAKHDMYELMNRWTEAGIAILLITSELQELLAMADRILVMHRGRIGASYSRQEATQEKIIHAAMGDIAYAPA